MGLQSSVGTDSCTTTRFTAKHLLISAIPARFGVCGSMVFEVEFGCYIAATMWALGAANLKVSDQAANPPNL